MSSLVLLGGNLLNTGVAARAALTGRRVVVVDWNERPDVVGDEHVRLDIKDAGAVLTALSKQLDDVAVAYTSADVATETVAQIHAAIGVNRPSPESLVRARDKRAMNAAWDAAGLLGKQHRSCASATDLAEFCGQLHGKAIVKPAEASS